MQEQVGRQTIPLKVYRTPERLTVAAPMPGLEPEDIRVEVTAEGRLVLHGELRGVLKGDKDLLLDERSVGNYYRELDLPVPVDGESATVTYGNGVLVVALPAAERTRPAQLTLDRISSTRGKRVGSSGHPARPRSTEDEHSAQAAGSAESGGNGDLHGS